MEPNSISEVVIDLVTLTPATFHKQQLAADRSVLLIRLLQLRKVHAVVIRPNGPHRLKLSLSGTGDRKDEEEEEEERGGDGEDHGGIKTSEICSRKKKGR